MRNNTSRMSFAAEKMSNIRIGQRLLIGMMTIVTILVIPTILVITQAVGYQNRYNRTLENLGDISYIIQETETQGYRIIDYFTMDKNIEESGEAEIIVNMLYRIKQIRSNIGTDARYQANLDTLQIVDNLLNNYADSFKKGAGKCDETYSMAGDTDFYSMVDTATYIVKNCNKLQALEMNRSEDLKDEISGGFIAMLITIVVIVAVVILLVIFFIATITESITYPLGMLMSHIAGVARSGLLDSDSSGSDKEVQ